MEEKIISGEVSFIPIETANYLDDVENVIEIIKRSGLDYEINSFSTIIRGNKSKIFETLQQIFETMETRTKFVLVVKISNTCGCEV
ncbi:MAG: YkoF family thiamine/hydroxymethylpyrimidine-binding protein [Candidatus Kapaibacteriota bacterium]|jgi:uncharacterized protein YqgV (UPF0045/DUF77 family)